MSGGFERFHLAQGDALLQGGDYDGALRNYAQVARSYTEGGFALKAVALWKQVREIIQRHAPEQRALDEEARVALVPLFRLLGLHHDADELVAENRALFN
jgi:ATP phosphoribosyltransferase regulatory subunit HisZ